MTEIMRTVLGRRVGCEQSGDPDEPLYAQKRRIRCIESHAALFSLDCGS
jgi:hypothetical protein